MGIINRYSRRTPYEGSLYQLPIELIAQTLDFTQKKFDTNRSIAESIQDFTIPSLPQDREVANQLQRQYSEQVDAVVKEYSGDYSKASNKLRDLTRTIKKDFNPGGKAAAISGNYTNYNTWLKNSQELVEKGKALGEDLNLANTYHMKNYQGIGEFNPVSGAYNMFTPEALTEYTDPDSIIQDTYKNFKPEKRKVGKTVFRNGLQVYEEQEQEGITVDRLNPSFYSALSSDPKYTQYMQQKAKYMGLSPNDVETFTKQYAAQRATDLSYMSTSDITKAERDPLFLLQEKQRLKDASDKKIISELTAQYKWEPTTQAMQRQEANIDPNDWRNSFSGLNYNNKDAMFAASIMSGIPLMSLTPGSESKYKDKALLDVLFNQEFMSKTHIDPILAKEIWKTESSKNAKAYVENYGKNKAWTDEFDKQFLTIYKNTEASFSRQMGSTLEVVSPKARQSAARTIAGRLIDPKSVQVIRVGEKHSQTAEAAGLSQEDIIDPKTGKLLTDDISIAQPGPGYAASGLQISTKKGRFIIVDENIQRAAYNKELASALNPIFFDGINTSPTPIRVGSAR